MTLDDDRRAQLERARAAALLRTCFGIDPDALGLRTEPFGVVGSNGHRGFVVSMRDDLAMLGGVLVWLDRMPDPPAEGVELVVDHHAGVHARRAAVLAPECRVWRTVGDRVERADPEPLPAPLPPPGDTAELEAVLAGAGLDIVVEDGIVRGEIAGLEVARVLHGPDGPVLEAGVGRFDREAGTLLHGGRPPADAVADAAAQVRPHRVPGAPPHPVNRLARERWLRAMVMADPGLVGVRSPRPVEPIPPRRSLLEVAPAALVGTDEADPVRAILVVCSVGVDLGLVPAVADLLARHGPDEVRIVVPARDRLAHLDRLAGRIPVPTEIRSVPEPWTR